MSVSRTAADAVDTAARLIEAGERVAIIGLPSAGKSKALRLVAEELRDRTVLHVRTPPRGDDAGPVALTELAAQLGATVLDYVQEPRRTWSDKLQRCREALSARPGVVVAVDDARVAVSGQPTQIFDDRAAEMLTALADLKQVGLAFTAHAEPGFRATRFPVQPRLDDEALASILGELRLRPALRAAVDALEGHAPVLKHRSPVEIRLAVALVSGGFEPDEVDRIAGARRLARAFVTRLPPHLQSALRRLAVLRLPCDLATRDLILGVSGMSANFPLDVVAMYETAEGWVLPSLLGEELLELEREQRLAPDRGRILDAHRAAASYHEQRFAIARSVADVPRAVRHEMEVIHHLTEAQDALAVLDRSLWFVEQYDALGKTVGLRGSELYRLKKPGARPRDAGPPPDAEQLLRHAVTAYERALAHEPRDAYALHYRAYNQDVLADDAAAVEQGYRDAREEDPWRVWHHGRLIMFLVTRGRPRDARAEWDEALRQLDGLRGHPWFYKELHRVLALLLLHRGNVEFAAEVLEDVPEAFEGDGWFPALRRRLILLQDHERDALVFPPSTPVEDRWLAPRLALNAEVVRWLPGRIESVDDQHVSVRFADRDGGGQEILGRERYTLTDFRAVCDVARDAIPPSGTFLERLWLAGESTEQVRCHPVAREDELPPPFPPPDRYLNRAAARPRR